MRFFRPVIRFIGFCLALVLFVCLCLTLFFAFAPKEDIAREQLTAFLRKYDINIAFDIASISHNQIVFQNIALLPENAITAQEVKITYDLSHLLNMEADGITITSPQIHWKKTENGYTIAGLERYFKKETEELKEEAEYTTPTLPFHKLVVEDGIMTLPLSDTQQITTGISARVLKELTGNISLHQLTLPLASGETFILPSAEVARASADAPFIIKVENVYHATSKKPWFSPLTLKGEVMPDMAKGTFTGSASLTSLFPQLKADMVAEGSFTPFTFRLRFAQPDIAFATGLIQPDNLFPVLRGYAEQVSGTVGLEGEMAMDKTGKLESRGAIRMKDISGTISKVAIERINGTLHFNSLLPLAATKQQNLSVDGIMLGLPLYNGKLSFTLAEDGTIHFHGNRWQWAGGYVHTTGLTGNIYNFKPPKTTLYAKNVDVADLLSGLLKQGISAEGTVSGELPVSFTEDAKIMITNGTLTADGPGRIIYAPTENSPLQKGQSFQTDLLLQAVGNFHYDAFSLRLNSENPNYMTIAMHLGGRNPESFNGQRVELNVNLNGDLIDILFSSMDIYSLPSRLQEQINQ